MLQCRRRTAPTLVVPYYVRTIRFLLGRGHTSARAFPPHRLEVPYGAHCMYHDRATRGAPSRPGAGHFTSVTSDLSNRRDPR